MDVEYPKDLHDLHRNLPYLAEKKRKLINVINLYVVCKKKKLCCSHKSFKKSIKYLLIFKKVHRLIKFKQEAWLKLYIDMDTELRKQVKIVFEKDFLS